MWRDHPSPQNTSPSIHPNLKKNFNPFEILEPQKLPVNGSLIDLSIPGEATYPTNSVSNNKEKGFSNIDLLENILVTPQLVSNQPKSERNIDFDDFFNKLESGTKFDWTNNNSSENENGEASLADTGTSLHINKPTTLITERKTNSVLEIDSLFDKLVKNDGRATKYETMPIEHYHEGKIVEEDIIEEVLLDKTLEKMTLTNKNFTDYGGKVKVLTTPKLTTNCDHKREERNKSNDDMKINSISKVDKNSKVSIRYSELKHNSGNDIKMIPKPNILILSNESSLTKAGMEADPNTPKFKNHYLHSNNASSSKWDKHEPTAAKMNIVALESILHDASLRFHDKNTQRSTQGSVNRKFAIKERPINPELLLQGKQKCMIKETKHFTKYNMPCNDPNKDKYTPGPSYAEKVIALPNILDRLNKQKKAYDYKINMPRRLILDEGAKRRNNVKQIDDLNPISLKEDCNKERLEAYMIGKKLENLVNKGSYL